MKTISNITVELELRELRRKLLCYDLLKYIFTDKGIEPDTEKYDYLVPIDDHYKYDEKDYTKFKKIHRYKCF